MVASANAGTKDIASKTPLEIPAQHLQRVNEGATLEIDDEDRTDKAESS